MKSNVARTSQRTHPSYTRYLSTRDSTSLVLQAAKRGPGALAHIDNLVALLLQALLLERPRLLLGNAFRLVGGVDVGLRLRDICLGLCGEQRILRLREDLV